MKLYIPKEWALNIITEKEWNLLKRRQKRDNIITATFNDYTYARTTSLWQYDYGQILQIEGITLPATFEVHFSDQDREGESLIQIRSRKRQNCTGTDS
ncbi:MAG: hypothetical protein ACLRH0_07195 [Blautia wexlerae]